MNVLFKIIKDDLFRYAGNVSILSFLKYYLLNPGFKYSFWFRISNYCSGRFFFLPISFFCFFIQRHYTYKFGIHIPKTTKVGKGLYIGHFGSIFINKDVIIGRNLNISQDVTIGQSNRGSKKGVPKIGNEVYIGPGAKIIGKIVIGDRVCIGANAVVLEDIPDNAVVAGNPATIKSYNGTNGYVNRIVFD